MTRPLNEPEKRVIWASAMGNPTDIVAAELSKPLCATAPKVNLSQVILVSGLRQEKARETERLTQVGEGHISVRYGRMLSC